MVLFNDKQSILAANFDFVSLIFGFLTVRDENCEYVYQLNNLD